MYDENSMCVEIDGYEGTFTCTKMAYCQNNLYYLEMTNDEDDSFVITILSNGELYEESSFIELGIEDYD